MSVKIWHHQPSFLVSLSLSVFLYVFTSLSHRFSVSLSLFLLGIFYLCQFPLPSHQLAAVRLSLLTLSKEPATLHFNDPQDKEKEAALWLPPSPGNELVAH